MENPGTDFTERPPSLCKIRVQALHRAGSMRLLRIHHFLQPLAQEVEGQYGEDDGESGRAHR